jgi:hypothetical protein
MADTINQERTSGGASGQAETFHTPEASDDEEAADEAADEGGAVLWDFDGAEQLMGTDEMVEGAKELHAMLRGAKTIRVRIYPRSLLLLCAATLCRVVHEPPFPAAPPPKSKRPTRECSSPQEGDVEGCTRRRTCRQTVCPTRAPQNRARCGAKCSTTCYR